MMLYQFTLLEKQEQIDLIEKLAIYIAERTDGDYTYRLHQLDAIYIEEQWHTKFNERRSFTCFTSNEKLKPYLNFINTSVL
jgi:hypothetical protein